MKSLKDSDPDSYKRHFARYVSNSINAEDLEKKWTGVHAAIRKDPSFKKSTEPKVTEQKHKPLKRQSLATKKNKIRQRIASRAKAEHHK